MSYCGTFITAEELHDKYGGVTMVVDTLEELMPAAMDKARELCRRGPLVLRYLKACMMSRRISRSTGRMSWR